LCAHSPEQRPNQNHENLNIKEDYKQKALNILGYQHEGGLKMTIEVIGKFKPQKGVQTYRINGSYEDLYKIIDELREVQAKFDQTPLIQKLRKGQWTMLLKIKLPTEIGNSIDSTYN